MGFKFSASQVDFVYKGKTYNLPINARLANDVEIAMGTHPVNLLQKILNANSKQEFPPIGQMTAFFTFVLKRAGAVDVDEDEVYGELFGGEYSSEIGESIGNILALFVPRQDEVDPKPKARNKKK